MKRWILTLVVTIIALIVFCSVQAFFAEEAEKQREIGRAVPEIKVEPAGQIMVRMPEVTDTPEQIAEETYWDELELLAICVEAEAGNQSFEGKRLVVAVILNRVDNPDFPDSITEVIEQKYHFSSFWNGAMDRVWEPSEETYRAVLEEAENRSNTQVLYFTAGGYGEYGTPWKQVGDHYFCTK